MWMQYNNQILLQNQEVKYDMKYKARYLQIILLMGLMISTPAMAEWITYCDTDEQSGGVNGGVSTYSLPDNSSSKVNPIILSYNDMPYGGKNHASNFYIFNSQGFPGLESDLECDKNGCRDVMYLTSKFNKDTKFRTLIFKATSLTNNKIFILATSLSKDLGFNSSLHGGADFKKRIRQNDNLKISSGGEMYTFSLIGLDDAIKKLRKSCKGIKGLNHIEL